MRITNAMLHRRSLEGLGRNLEAIETAHRQVSSGLRVEKPSDDPVATGSIMRASGALRALERYGSNLSTGRSRLGAEEAVLEQLDGVLVRAKELALSQSGSTADAATRSMTANEVAVLSDHVRDLGNTVFGGSYLFGGMYADSKPFPTGGPDPARMPSGERSVEVGAGSTVPTNHSGEAVFLDSGVMDSLAELQTALENDDPTAIQTAVSGLDAAFRSVQELTAEVGARGRRLEVARANVESLDVNLRSLRSDLQDAELEEAVTELVNRQTGYQAALLANSRILQTTLTDYLR